MNMSQVAHLDGIQKCFGPLVAIDQLSFSLNKGECLALVGHNGAGKSTLIKMILGLIKPSHGKISILGCDPNARGFEKIKQKIGFLPEQILFQKNLTGRETLAFYARLKGLSGRELEGLFERVDLAHATDRKVGTYSKGMRQRLGVAQALLGAPELLVLDEPTSGLDPVARQNIYRIMEEEKLKGTTVLISSHVLTELDERIDRVLILNGGKIAADGSIPYLRNQKQLMSTIYLEGSISDCDKIQGVFRHELEVHRSARKELYIRCPQERKVKVLNSLLLLGVALEDVKITDPSLEQVFNSYMMEPAMGVQYV